MSIPAPPPRAPTRGKRRGGSGGVSRLGTWGGALVIGGVMGAASYQLLRFIADYFDYWMAVLAS